MRYSVCTSAVFRGLPMKEALPRVRRAGARAYEFWAWWEEDLAALAALQAELGLKPAAFCTHFVPMNLLARRADFLRGLEASLAAAERLGCPVLIAQAGQDLPGVARAEQEGAILGALREAAALLKGGGVCLALEPLNTKINHQGYFLDKAGDAFRLAQQVNSPHIKVLYDIYHQFITEGSPLSDILANLAIIAHFHLAGFPGRHEPWLNSRIAYQPLLDAIDRAGYQGLIGLEYMPKDPARAEEELKGFLNQEGANR